MFVLGDVRKKNCKKVASKIDLLNQLCLKIIKKIG
jgi:hypothetical protein